MKITYITWGVILSAELINTDVNELHLLMLNELNYIVLFPQQNSNKIKLKTLWYCNSKFVIIYYLQIYFFAPTFMENDSSKNILLTKLSYVKRKSLNLENEL